MQTKIILVLIADIIFRILIDKLNMMSNDNFLVNIYLKQLHDIATEYGSLVDACKSIRINYYELLDMLNI